MFSESSPVEILYMQELSMNMLNYSLFFFGVTLLFSYAGHRIIDVIYKRTNVTKILEILDALISALLPIFFSIHFVRAYQVYIDENIDFILLLPLLLPCAYFIYIAIETGKIKNKINIKVFMFLALFMVVNVLFFCSLLSYKIYLHDLLL